MIDTSLVELSLDQVPKYLQEGEYFRTLSDNDDDGLISVPANVLKADPSIADVADLEHLLLSLQFWIACNRDHKQSIIVFLMFSGLGDDVRHVVEEYQIAFPFLRVTWMALTMNLEPLSERHSTPLVQFVLDRHPAAVDILLHLSENESLQVCSHITDQCNDKVRSFLSSYSAEKVAESGDLEMLKILFRHDVRFNNLCYFAAKGGHLSCLQYLVGEGCSLLERRVPQIAASSGHVHILRYLYSVDSMLLRLNHLCTQDAAEKGHLDCLEFLLSVGGPRLPSVTSRAAQGGHIDCLVFAHENGYPWHTDTCSSAAGNGHLNCLQYAHEHGCVWDETTAHSAVMNCHLQCLQYAHTNGCPWDVYTCFVAATNGQLACLQYAHESGCPWDESTTQAALIHFPCLAYALRNNCAYSSALALTAFERGMERNGFYILQHCTSLDNAICTYAAEHGRLDILEACVSAGVPWHEETCAVAVACGHRSCFEFARDHGAPVGNEEHIMGLL